MSTWCYNAATTCASLVRRRRSLAACSYYLPRRRRRTLANFVLRKVCSKSLMLLLFFCGGGLQATGVVKQKWWWCLQRQASWGCMDNARHATQEGTLIHFKKNQTFHNSAIPNKIFFCLIIYVFNNFAAKKNGGCCGGTREAMLWSEFPLGMPACIWVRQVADNNNAW